MLIFFYFNFLFFKILYLLSIEALIESAMNLEKTTHSFDKMKSKRGWFEKKAKECQIELDEDDEIYKELNSLENKIA